LTAQEPAAESRDRKLPDKRILVLVALIIGLGLALRLWGIGWSLPDARHPLATYHPDESINLNAARAADIPHGQFDIQFYNYGAFYFYLVSFAQTFGRGWGLIPTTPNLSIPQGAQPTAAQWATLAPENAALFLTGRIVTALLGAATIPLLFALGRRLYGTRVGLTAALLYAIAPLAVQHAHFLTVDVPATFFVTLALLWAARLWKQPDWKNVIWAGVWAGLAAATKYNTGCVLLAPLVALALARPSGERANHLPLKLAALIGVTAAAFLIACPGPWLDWNAFWNGTYPGSGVRYELFEHARTGHELLFVDTGPGWWYHLTASLRYGLGEPLLLLALAGFVFACIRRTPQDGILLSFFLLYYFTTSLSAVRFARYMIPLLPVLCLWAARLLAEPFPQRRLRQALAAIGTLVALYTLLLAFSFNLSMTGRDPRDQAADYLERNAPQGASIAFARIPWFTSPPLSPLFGLPAAPQRAKAAAETTRFTLRIPPVEWDTSVLSPPPDYVVLSNLETVNAVTRLHLPGPVRFVRSIPANDTRLVFAPPTLLGLPPNREGVGVPEDLLYTRPLLTLYRKP